MSMKILANETGGAAIENFVGLKPNMDLFLVDDNSDHKKARDVAATISHDEYKDVLMNKKCLRHSMNKNQKKISQNRNL